MKRLSIVTVCYNDLEGLKRTFNSVVPQLSEEVEYVVIDGGSSDGSRDLIEAHGANISYWQSEPDKGIYDAMNKGLVHTSGEYVLFLNCGDHFHAATSVSEALPFLDGVDLVAFDIHVLGKGHDYVKKHPEAITFSFLFEDTLAHQSVMIKRQLFSSVGLYDTDLKIVSDWKFFIHALALHGASYKSVHKVLTTYYLDGISATGPGSNLRKKERRLVLEKDFKIHWEDYNRLGLMNSNRFVLLQELEGSRVGQKLNSIWLRLLTGVLLGKSIKSIKKDQ